MLMKVTKYNTRLTEDRLPVLIKDATVTFNSHRDNFANVEDVVRFLQSVGLPDEAEEHLLLLCFTGNMRLIGYFTVSIGSVSYTIMPIREIIMKSLALGASELIIAHNHPSGDCEPSSYDYDSTRDLNKVLKLMGMELADHIVVSGDEYFSFREEGKIA